MKLQNGILKAVILLALAALLAVSAGPMVAGAQYAQAGAGAYAGTGGYYSGQYPYSYSGNIYNQCPAGYYFDQYRQQCLPYATGYGAPYGTAPYYGTSTYGAAGGYAY